MPNLRCLNLKMTPTTDAVNIKQGHESKSWKTGIVKCVQVHQ